MRFALTAVHAPVEELDLRYDSSILVARQAIALIDTLDCVNRVDLQVCK